MSPPVIVHFTRIARRGIDDAGFDDAQGGTMSDYQQLVYASRATFAPTRGVSSIDIEVARILTASRRNNPRRGLVGALYYSNGFFFQCLQGSAQALDTLYAQLASDPRHRDIVTLQRKPIAAPSFSEWAMKYVPNASEIKTVLARFGRDQFDPLSFDEPVTEAMVDLLRLGPDANLAAGATEQSALRNKWLWAVIGVAALAGLLVALL